MARVPYETDETIFEFKLLEVMERLNYYAIEHKIDAATQLIDFISKSSDESINIKERG